TMMWGRNAPAYQEISLRARKGSNEYILAVMERAYPGSWLPTGEEQILGCAAPYFRLLSRNNGRKDYIETMNQWDRVWKWNARKIAPALKLVPRFLLDPDFRYKLETLRNGYNKVCFIREVMDHQRLIFEAIEPGQPA
ncbi:MAG: SAM-dependent methyltransferase, partial [Chloroflexota bacterium]